MIKTSEDNFRVISIALNQCSYQCRVGWHFEEETEALHLACSVLLVAIDNFAEEVTQRSTSSERGAGSWVDYRRAKVRYHTEHIISFS